MAKMNGWKKISLIGGVVIIAGGALTFIKDYAPWSPRITFAIAAENSIARLDNQLYTLVVLQDQAKKNKDSVTVNRLELQIREKERLIEEMKALKKEHK